MTRVNARKWAELMLDEEAYAPLAQEIIAMDELIARLVEAAQPFLALDLDDMPDSDGEPYADWARFDAEVSHGMIRQLRAALTGNPLGSTRVTDATSAQEG